MWILTDIALLYFSLLTGRARLSFIADDPSDRHRKISAAPMYAPNSTGNSPDRAPALISWSRCRSRVSHSRDQRDVY